MLRAIWIEQPRGRPEVSLEAIDGGLALVADHPRRFAQLLFCRAFVSVDLGRHAEVEADLREVERIARQLGDHWLDGYLAWTRMITASLAGDAEQTISHARAAIAAGQVGNWWPADGSEFLADAADCLDRVGEPVLANEYLERARRQPKQADAQSGTRATSTDRSSRDRPARTLAGDAARRLRRLQGRGPGRRRARGPRLRAGGRARPASGAAAA
jgi:hypothetical protein